MRRRTFLKTLVGAVAAVGIPSGQEGQLLWKTELTPDPGRVGAVEGLIAGPTRIPKADIEVQLLHVCGDAEDFWK